MLPSPVPSCATARTGSMASATRTAATRDRTRMRFLLANMGSRPSRWTSRFPQSASALLQRRCRRVRVGPLRPMSGLWPRCARLAAWAGAYGQRGIAGCARELERVEAQPTYPTHASDTRLATLSTRHIDEDLREWLDHRILDDTLRDVFGDTHIARVDLDDQRFEMGLLVERAPSSVRCRDPALQRVGRQQRPARIVSAHWNAKVRLRPLMTGGTAREHSRETGNRHGERYWSARR